MSRPSMGIWLVGARGGVATTAILGLCGLKEGLVGTTGLISGLPPFAALEPLGWDGFLVGGHEIRDVSLSAEADRLVSERAIDATLVSHCKAELERIDRRIRPGTLFRVGPTIERLAASSVPRDATPRQAVERLQEDMKDFAESNRLDHVIVVNVSSTEPAVGPSVEPTDDGPAAIGPTWAELERLLEKPEECPLPASSLYAIAALDLGYSYINFTPSLGSAPAAIDELARLRKTRHMGCDGKTGETLMKSVLAPLFALRNLEVMSWVGHNIFGNMDGRVLDDPVNKKAKVTSKDHLLGKILGYRPQTHVSIEHLRITHISLGQTLYRRRNRGAKKKGLPRLRTLTQYLLDIRPKTNVQHAVGFVQNGNPQIAQKQRAAAHVVHHAAGRANHNLRPAAKFFDLLPDRFAAIHGNNAGL